MLNLFPPHAGEGGLDFFLEARNQFPVGGDEGLLGFDLGDDLLLGGEGWKPITNYELGITNFHLSSPWWIFGWLR